MTPYRWYSPDGALALDVDELEKLPQAWVDALTREMDGAGSTQACEPAPTQSPTEGLTSW